MIRAFIYAGVRKNTTGVFEKYTTIFLKQNDHNALFLGSSRTEMHFDPRIFDSITGLNSYNLGITAATTRIAYGILRSYCFKSTKPTYLIYDIDYHFLKYGTDTIRHFTRFFPYLQNEVLYEEFNKIDPRFRSFKHNPLHSLPYSNIGLLGASLHGWLNTKEKFDADYYKGYPNKVPYTELQLKKTDRFYSWFHPTQRAYLDSIIAFSKTNKIKLILVTSPMFAGGNTELINRSSIVKQIQNIALMNDLTYLDLSHCSFSDRHDCFTDYYHLTHKGSVLFSNEFSLYFKQYLFKNSVN